MNIAFCANKLALVGLGVTVVSLLRNCTDTGKLNIWFLCQDFSIKEKTKIKQLLQFENYAGKYYFIDFNPSSTFRTFPSLHGDWMPYGRLLLADLIEEESVLYLDADLVVELDVAELESFLLNDYILAAVRGGRFRDTLGQKFYREELGICADTDYFNSGVLLLNLEQWRIQKFKEKCLRLGALYQNDLPSHDQSLLNILLQGDFAKLPPYYNSEWLPQQPKPTVSERMILHFTGSPKPWDPLGSYIHNGYKTWKKYSTDFTEDLDSFSLKNIQRVWNIRRSYIRSNKRRISS